MVLGQNKIIRTSPALVALPACDGSPKNMVGVYEFLSKSFAFISINSLHWLDYFRDGMKWLQAINDHQPLTADGLWQEIKALIDLGFISVDGTGTSRRQSEYRELWKWDLSSGLFHFTVSDESFYSEEDGVRIQIEKLLTSKAPTKSLTHNGKTATLPELAASTAADLLRLMASRRTNRLSSGHRISRAELGACLFAGMGIVGEVEAPTGMLPLSLTPSGGARNPFEAYVFVNSGEDINSGVYHYSSTQHTLRCIVRHTPKNQDRFFANQKWANGKSAIILLVANMERLMWKYPDPNAYRVMLIEAGHIGQNIMLAATKLQLTVCPTAALAHSPLAKELKLGGLTQTPIYALTLDKQGSSSDQVHLNPTHESLFSGEPATLKVDKLNGQPTHH